MGYFRSISKCLMLSPWSVEMWFTNWMKWPFWPDCPIIWSSFGQFWTVLDGRNWTKEVLSSFFHFVRKKQVLDGKKPTLSNTDWDWDCHTKMFEKKANEIVCLIHVIKIYLQRMALFLRMINTWWFDTWTWPWMHVYVSTNHVYCYEFIITIVGINALQYIQSIVTQTWVK